MSRALDLLTELIHIDTDDCVRWPLGVFADGYGKVRKGKKTYQAHRLAYEMLHGEVLTGDQILHHCDTPPCVNGKHLFPGSHGDNVADKVLKQRQSRSEEHGRALLSVKDVRAIRARYVFGSQEHGTPAIAAHYGLHQTTVWDIVNKRLWREIE